MVNKIYSEINKSGFEAAASIFSISDSKNFGGKLGWIKSSQISKKIYSPLSIIFALRNEILNNNDIYNYQVYSAGKLKDINISVIGKENIRTPYGVYEAIILSPKSIDGKSAMKNKGDMKIWLTNDEKRLPLKIELKLKHGSILLLLDNIE